MESKIATHYTETSNTSIANLFTRSKATNAPLIHLPYQNHNKTMDISTATKVAEILAAYHLALLEIDRELKAKAAALEKVEELRVLKKKVTKAMVVVAGRIRALNALLVEDEEEVPFEGNVLFVVESEK
ncbi:hypothetical protein ONS95_003853 [Cadophora gregata]|uniref:uncharacterized protein n=1 Tax=Cadophora gregata TaxID=51156 RepID=UPI0026DB0CBF|nr:uncharacterized protein ONS95_003853 [Cadophora gregata]KAK0107147.1 hypothetical protein ONS95_003853 [Cadophora gregata]KAK0116832.1 hypothetical protein ONS96_012681 [Cadophora gregata f. sp. sojae]